MGQGIRIAKTRQSSLEPGAGDQPYSAREKECTEDCAPMSLSKQNG
jgi:hypothetical protein